MKEFKLDRVKYKNILSVGNAPIDINLSAYQKTLITGKNGAGKSTMLEAICFALFGKPFRDITKGLLVNMVTKKELVVELWFTYGKDTYYIKRGQKPNIFEITKNGVELAEDASVKDFQEKFEEMIGMNMSSFKSTVVLGTAGYTPFMQLKTAERRKLVEDLLQTSQLGVMDKLNKTRIREINQAISVIDMQIESVQAQIDAQVKFAEQQKKVSEDNLGRYQELYDQQVNEAKTAKSNITKLKNLLAETVLGEDPSSEYSRLNSELSVLQRDKATYSKVLALYDKGGMCPTCMQDLSDTSKTQQIKESIQDCETKVQAASSVLQEVKEQMSAYSAQKDKISNIKNKINQLTETLKKSVENAKSISVLMEKASREKVDNSDIIRKLSEEKDKHIEAKSELNLEKYHRGILTEMLKDTGVKSAIISKYVPLFNKQINFYLKKLGADYVFTLDEEFKETIKSRGREQFSYYSFSQGEKARIDISLLFTWRDIASMVSGVNIKSLFMDEIMDGPSDDEAIKGIMTIINDMKDTNTFIISHGDHNPQDYGQHLQMKKVGRFTVL
ncbi:recombination-related endonuclease Gp46 [Providencia phage PSTCR6]|nr:recombination-related endonuclease Gp46 [Providencia phage PSTCR6]